MRKKEKTTYNSNKIDELRRVAEQNGMTLSELVDRYVVLGDLLHKSVKEGKKIYAQKEGELEKESIPVKEFLEMTGSD